MKFTRYVLFLLLLAGLCLGMQPAPAHAGDPTPAELLSGAPRDVPFPGTVTLVDIGAHACIPCKMMTPVLKEVSEEYAGRAAVVFIDVWEHKEERDKYGIRVIPTQIFYDRDGVERFRHEGFLNKHMIAKKFAELGVE